jgi:tetratricopeptide (TPR) repeat protein
VRRSCLVFLLVLVFGCVTPAAADTVSEALAAGDAHFAAARYDSAAGAYEPGFQELQRSNRFADLKFLLRNLSDRFYRENKRYQPRPNVTVGHGTYVKLCGHSERLFARYCNLVADHDPRPDEKLATLGKQLLADRDFRGGIAHEVLAQRFPHSPEAPGSLYRAGCAYYHHGLHRSPERKKSHAEALLKAVLERYPRGETCDDALLELGNMAETDYRLFTSVASLWRKRLAEVNNPTMKEAAQRDLAALQRKFGSLQLVEEKVEQAWQQAFASFSQAVTEYPTGNRAPSCLMARAALHLQKSNREAARRDLFLLQEKYPREKRVADALLKRHGL